MIIIQMRALGSTVPQQIALAKLLVSDHAQSFVGT